MYFGWTYKIRNMKIHYYVVFEFDLFVIENIIIDFRTDFSFFFNTKMTNMIIFQFEWKNINSCAIFYTSKMRKVSCDKVLRYIAKKSIYFYDYIKISKFQLLNIQ